MARKWMVGLAVFAMAAGILLAGLWVMISAQAAAAAPLPSSSLAKQPPRLPTTPPGRSSDAPEISFIDSPGATCHQLNVRSNDCAINWSYLYVTADSSQYIISMTVAIDGQKRTYIQGFFQSYIYLPPNIFGDGLRVTCGAPGSGGNPYLGNAYSYTIRARQTGGQGSANYGTVYCPVDSRLKMFLPITPRRR